MNKMAQIEKIDLEFNKNEDAMKLLYSSMKTSYYNI